MASGLAACALIRYEEKSVVPSGREIGAELGAAGLRAGRLETRLQRVAEGVVGSDVVPLLAGVLDDRRRHRVGLHLRRVADAEHVPVAARASDGVGVAAGDHVQDALLAGDLGHGQRQGRIDVAEQEADLVAVDQLSRLLDRRTGVAAGGILDEELDLPTENAALGVDLLDRQLAADHLVLADRGIGARERIVEADLHRVCGAHRNDERRRQLQQAGARGSLDHLASANRLLRLRVNVLHGRSLSPVGCSRESRRRTALGVATVRRRTVAGAAAQMLGQPSERRAMGNALSLDRARAASVSPGQRRPG